MTERMAKIIQRSITKEDEVIGNLKSQFIKPSLRGQKFVGISPSIAVGNIALAYHRGLAEGQRDSQKQIDYWKNKYLKLKNKIG